MWVLGLVAKKSLPEDETEGDKGKKRARSELELENEDEDEDEDEGRGTIIGNMVKKDGVTWVAEDGRICYLCRKAHWRCLWREEGGKCAKVCLHCNENKKGCRMTAESDKTGAGPPR